MIDHVILQGRAARSILLSAAVVETCRRIQLPDASRSRPPERSIPRVSTVEAGRHVTGDPM